MKQQVMNAVRPGANWEQWQQIDERQVVLLLLMRHPERVRVINLLPLTDTFLPGLQR